MSTFKVGDRVRVLPEADCNLNGPRVGDVFEVVRIDDDGDIWGGTGRAFFFYPHELELETPPEPEITHGPRLTTKRLIDL